MMKFLLNYYQADPLAARSLQLLLRECEHQALRHERAELLHKLGFSA